jgi:peptide/nickel transport system substrate-binding protein
MNRRTPLIAAVAGTVAIALVAGCSSSKSGGGGGQSGGASTSSNNASGAVVNPGYTTKGGTVNILNDSDYESLDPANNYVTNEGVIGRLIYRTLTFIKDTPNEKPVIKPDLAESLGTQSDGGKTWTWKIRKGLKYEDGTPITAKEIKYGIERSFATDIYKDGATYMPDTLNNTNDYKGPYLDPTKDLTAVETPDDYTLTLHFAGPQPDADWMMSLFYSAPVPKAKDDKQNYGQHPVSSGPYKIESYTPSKQLVLARNPNWDPATDPNRPALPDKFVVNMGIAAPTISARIISNQGADQTAVTTENSGALQSADLPKLRDPSVKSRFTTGPTPCVFYSYLNMQTVKDTDVRKAIFTAINRKAAITALGGDLFGFTQDSYMSTTVRGYAPPNLGLNPQGDPTAAKALLQGKTVPTLHYGVRGGSPKQKALGVSIQNDLKQIGVNLVLDTIPGDAFYKTLRGDQAPDMSLAGWCWDWPTQAAIVPPVLGPDSTGKKWSSNNFSRYIDSTVSPQITKLASSTEPPAQVDKQFSELSNKLQTTVWPLLPVQASLDPQVVGGKIQNGGVSTIYGEIDLNTIGVKP